MNPSLTEMKTILNSPAFPSRNGMSEEASRLFEMVDQRQPKKALKVAIKKTVIEKEKQKWDTKLQNLRVQVSEIVKLKEDTKVWAWIMDGLPNGQLPFLL